METKKYITFLMAIFSIISLGFISCNDDDDDEQTAQPVVTLTEVGHSNSKHTHPGHDLHLEASILAEGTIKRIDIEIHQKGGANKIVETAYTEGKYIGVKNADFHEHLDIPADAALGEYHLHFTVTDNEGQQTTAECSIELIEDDDDDEEEHEHNHQHE